MIIADQQPVSVTIIGVTILIGLAVGALYLFRGYEYLANRSLRQKLEDFTNHPDPQTGVVILKYHTYHGFLAWFTQSTIHVALPPDEARVLLGRLLRYNLTWGLVTPGVIFILPLAILNYFAQLRSIAAQEATGGLSEIIMEPADIEPADMPVDPADVNIVEYPSMFHRIFGWIAAGLCVLFGITIFVSLVNGEFEAAIGGVIITVLFGLVARDWLDLRKTKSE